jgi:hypothetical protein
MSPVELPGVRRTVSYSSLLGGRLTGMVHQ